jgi:hypothetical protein
MKKKTSKKFMPISAKNLKDFLTSEYNKKGGADTMFTAIRDCLTDMHYIWDEIPNTKGHSILSRTIDAQEVYNIESKGVE